jgi:hypothetical protein
MTTEISFGTLVTSALTIPKIKSGRIFRTATMTFFQGESRFDDLLWKSKSKQ